MAVALEEWAEAWLEADPAERAKFLIDHNQLLPADFNALLAERSHYWPQGGQDYLHNVQGARIKVAAGGWRSGKSRWMGREVSYTLASRPNAGVWIIGADYELAQPEFDYARDDLRALRYPAIVDLSQPQQGRWKLTLANGSWLETQTAEDLKKIEAKALDKVALAEAGSLTEALLTLAEGRVLEKRGEVVMSGRFHGSHSWYTELWRQGQVKDNQRRVASASLRTWDNRFFFPPCDPATCTITEGWPRRNPRETHGGFHNPDILYHLWNKTEDEFGEMFAAEPRPDRSLVYADFWDRKVHMIEMSFEDSLQGPLEVVDAGRKVIGVRLPRAAPKEIWVDPGYAGAYAVLAVQMHGPIVYVIDELYLRGVVGPQVAELAARQWWFPYVKSGVIDVAALQHHAMDNQVEVWLKDPTNLYLRSKAVLVKDGIERVRTFLRDPKTRRPRLYFSPNCVMTATEMESGYRYARIRHDEDTRQDKEEPVQLNNHACSALAYGLCMNYGNTEFSYQAQAVTHTY
jgi:hypothetical protein